jgi:hypothetical protein
MAWNGESWLWPDWNSMECPKLVFALLEWLEMEEVGFVLTGIASTGANRFWLNWNGFEWIKSVLA